MNKKLLALISAAIMSIGVLAGCGDSQPAEQASPSSSASSASSTESTASTASKTESKADKDESAESTNAQQVIQVPVTIVNNTDVDFHELYTSGSGTDDWGDDLLGGQVLSPGTQLTQIAFNIDADNLKWDLMAKDEAGDSLEFYGLDLSECSTDGITISLTYDRDTETGTVTAQ